MLNFFNRTSDSESDSEELSSPTNHTALPEQAFAFCDNEAVRTSTFQLLKERESLLPYVLRTPNQSSLSSTSGFTPLHQVLTSNHEENFKTFYQTMSDNRVIFQNALNSKHKGDKP